MRARPLFAPLLLACLLSGVAPDARGASRLEADLVVVNARVRTLDAARPEAEAVAVAGRRIAAVGTTGEIKKLAGADVAVYQTLFERGELKTLVYAVAPPPAWERLKSVGVRLAFGSDWSVAPLDPLPGVHAAVTRRTHAKGSIAPGKLADFVILTRDIFNIDPAEIERARVRLTVVDGRVVYEAAK